MLQINMLQYFLITQPLLKGLTLIYLYILTFLCFILFVVVGSNPGPYACQACMLPLNYISIPKYIDFYHISCLCLMQENIKIITQLRQLKNVFIPKLSLESLLTESLMSMYFCDESHESTDNAAFLIQVSFFLRQGLAKYPRLASNPYGNLPASSF